jgi:hypothetical protein
MYTHNILRINYTTYDIRRAQDTINPNTHHRNIMVLADGDDADGHPFLYGCVLGVYHINVIYTGPGMSDYHARRLEFVWVGWYDHIKPYGSWSACTLDQLRFPAEGGYDFIDPADVIRSCHVIPAFAQGESDVNGQGNAETANANLARGWNRYYINR